MSLWSKAAHWTLDEAIALSFGKAPAVVSWEKVRGYVSQSHFADQYGKVRDLALRETHRQQLYDPVLPGCFQYSVIFCNLIARSIGTLYYVVYTFWLIKFRNTFELGGPSHWQMN